jgi:hypothetical protein
MKMPFQPILCSVPNHRVALDTGSATLLHGSRSWPGASERGRSAGVTITE